MADRRPHVRVAEHEPAAALATRVHDRPLDRFVTDLIAATLPGASLGVTAWYSSRDATGRLGVREFVRPDTAFILDTAIGAIECYLEWDRGSETQETLMHKLDGYRIAEGRFHGEPTGVEQCALRRARRRSDRHPTPRLRRPRAET